jgi:hypothetical protein
MHNASPIACLLLCLAIVGLWVRSHRAEQLVWGMLFHPQSLTVDLVCIDSSRGVVRLWFGIRSRIGGPCLYSASADVHDAYRSVPQTAPISSKDELLPRLRLPPHRQHQRHLPGMRHAGPARYLSFVSAIRRHAVRTCNRPTTNLSARTRRGMLRWPCTIASVLSLLLSPASVALWVRSRSREDVISRVVRGNRYTVISAAGKIGLYGPPPLAKDPKARADANSAATALDNDQIRWVGWFTYDPKPMLKNANATLFRDSAADSAERTLNPAHLVRPLLAALEDPQRFAMAHLLLLRQSNPQAVQWGRAWCAWDLSFDPSRPIKGRLLGKCAADFDDGRHTFASGAEVDFGGLNFTLDRWSHPEDYRSGETTSLGEWCHDMLGEPDVAQLPRIRDQWHRKLDVRVLGVSDWKLTIATAFLPLLTFGRLIRSRVLRLRRSRIGLCLACGYSLTGNTSGTCPECGTSVPKRPPTKAPGCVNRFNLSPAWPRT